MMTTDLSRRAAMLLGAALPVLTALPVAAQSAPEQEKPMGRANTIKLGAFEVTTILGGANMSDDPIATFGVGADAAEFQALAAENFIPSDRSGGSFTPTLVRTPDALILFDTGMFPEMNAASMALAGIKPEDVTHIVLTHMHGDHVSGLMQGDTPSFANAQLIVPKAENDYWAANANDAYKTHVAPLIGKARQIADGEEIVPGIKAEAAYGHTPGHTTYLIESEGQRLLISGDSFNHYVFSVQRPDWHVRFDVDKDMGAATRAKVLGRLAEEKIPFIGYHMPFPAVGFIAPNGQGSFRFVPATYQFA
ncbi:MBL fold metallo-hydrolase [Paracoccus laeviglucosivorans]|uniref:Glyoxylase, beta-lactamase superfamily II n=1 Tax=Paracoccus laeviglucosivorans TaxID=1197861 RepID=A0A521DKQ4_9RHOB|nr:MBL fold metallo-hydrolase [Paracoccus laeviglucosivorans]SMO72289.1 Glyoxylase, beta-lactamase superfamily II [Paracoccus laeviglucosivorans]